jgi:excisionase family DNA binding protein
VTARLLTIAEVAHTLGVSVSTVRRRVAEGELAVVHIGPRALRVRDEDVRRFIAARVALSAKETRVSSSGRPHLKAGTRLWD